MIDIDRTLGSWLSDPRIAPIAADAIAKWDLTREPMWNKTLRQLRLEGFGGDIAAGLERLFAAAEAGNWFFPLYAEAERAADAARADVSLVRLPSQDPGAVARPCILLVPGGGFVNVWNLTEGWPVAAQFNRLGYDVCVLTYRVSGEHRLLDGIMQDFARAVRWIRARAGAPGGGDGSYITCGFSAGGYLTCLWNVPEAGFAAFGLPGPEAVFPIYPLVSPKQCLRDGYSDPASDLRIYGCDAGAAARSPFEIPEHVGAFPPCALFVCAGDELVNPEHSRLLARALEEKGIPCRLEVGPEGGHGFADGTGICMAGWTERAIRWYEGVRGR